MSASNRKNLQADVPTEAVELLNNKPNVREEYDTVSADDYDGENGDLGELIKEAAENNQIVDLGSGTYEMSGVDLGSDVCGIVGDGSDACTIHCETGGEYLFEAHPGDFVMEGVSFEASGDVALATIQTGNQGWFEDVVFRGQRDKYEAEGARFTFLIEADEDASNLIHKCEFPDGGTNHPESDSVGHAIGPNADPSHEGLNVWKEVYCEGFMDNGFYVAYSPGQNILWNCTAINNGGANFRPGQNDVIVGGYSEASDLPDDRISKPLSFDSEGHPEVTGLEMYGEGDAVGGGGELIQIRADSGSISLDKTIAHGKNIGTCLARLDDVEINISNSWWLQENTGNTAVQVGRRSAEGDVTAENFRLEATDATEISGPISIDGEDYDGETRVGDVGLGSPRPFPEFHFGDSDDGASPEPTPEPKPEPNPGSGSQGELAVFAEDTETGQRLNGATATISQVNGDIQQSKETASIDIAKGGANFGELPTGYYQITVSLDGYTTGTYGEELWRDEGEEQNQAVHLDTEGRRPIIYLTPQSDPEPAPDQSLDSIVQGMIEQQVNEIIDVENVDILRKNK